MIDKVTGLLFICIGLGITYYLFKSCWQEGQDSKPNSAPEPGKYLVWFFISALGAIVWGIRYMNGYG